MLSLEKSKAKVERYEIEHELYKGFFVLVTDNDNTWNAVLGHDSYGILEDMFSFLKTCCESKEEFLEAVINNLLYNNYIEGYIRTNVWEEEE